MGSLVFAIYMTFGFIFVPQVRLNDCGPASMLMTATYYDREVSVSSEELHNKITDGKDRALHFTELVYYLEELYDIETEISYSKDIFLEASNRNDLIILMLRDEAHYVVLRDFTVFDPSKGVTDYENVVNLFDYLDSHDWVGFVVTERRNDGH